MLNLKKGDLLNLSKGDVNLSKLRLAAGWDITDGKDIDLDLHAVVVKDNETFKHVYFANKKEKGLQLDKDNRTGEGDGDDENIFINLNEIDYADEVQFFIHSYSRIPFRYVQNAYCRIVDESVSPEKEICKYMLSETGGKEDLTLCVGRLIRENNEWKFHAIGKYFKEKINKLI